MSKKLLVLFGLLTVFAMLVGACTAAPVAPAAEATEAAAEAPAEEAAAAAEPFRIALIMPSTTTDYSWSQSMYDGIIAVQAEMGGEFEQHENDQPADQQKRG